MRPTPLRILTVGPAPSGPKSRGGMASVMTLLADHPGDVSVRVVPTFVDDTRWRRLAVGVRGMALASVLIVLGRVDVVHVHLAHGGSVLRKSVPLLAARLRGVPSVVHAHSYDFGGWFERQRPVVQRAVRRGLRADRWIVLGSRHVSEITELLGVGADDVEVLHNPAVIGEVGLSHAAVGDRVEVVALGRLGRRKGSYDIVEAATALPDHVRSRIRISLAGDGELDQVRAAVDAAGVADVIQVLGWLEPDDRNKLLDASQALLLPSYEEGLPMALLESMARGLVPVVSPVGGIPNVVTDQVDALLVEPGDISAITKALIRLVEEPMVRDELRLAALERSKSFGVDSWYDRLMQTWEAVSRRSRR